jgi:hypothetical protein
VPSDAVARYHDLLTAEIAEESHAQLAGALRRRGLVFGDRALCTVVRPRLMAPATYQALQRRIRPLLRAFARAHARAMGDAGFRAQFGLTDWEETLLSERAPYPTPTPTSRLDFFFVDGSGSLGLTEYNAETPAGAAYTDALTEAFLGLPSMRAFTRRFEVLPVPARYGVVGALLDAWHQFSGTRIRPRIAILDWHGVPTATEFDLYREHFLAADLECVIEDPRHAEYRNGRLLVGGTAVDLVYKRVLISELVEQLGLDSAVVRAVREGAVCLVDGFHCKLLHKKASLAVLSDEANASFFDAAERRAIDDCIPWTRVVKERKTAYRGTMVDLVPFLLEGREHLVLKPNDDYGGRGITLGWTVDAAAWAGAVRDALATPHIVQERVEVPSEPYPSWVGGALHVHDRQYDTAPFVTNGDYMEGLLTRLSTSDLLNVTAGGGSTVPTFLVEPR